MKRSRTYRAKGVNPAIGVRTPLVVSDARGHIANG